ncbi:hypothetical protein GQ54DRAFT_320437 [Martensiomyces pterosporus]|nr:hypothetical protein GQ54DRAFT_320437 [Martensiomyces pterosporus]
MNEAIYYFTYVPTNTVPQIALAAYFIIGVVLVIQTVRARAQHWIFILAGTAFAESLGYAFRTACVYNITFGLYVLMVLFLLLPPNALALVNYKTLGMVVRESAASPRWFWLRPKFITWFFFASDLLSIALQGAGGGMSTQESLQDQAKIVALIGLTIQLVFFAAFFAIAIYVWLRPEYTVAPGPKDRDEKSTKRKVMSIVVVTTIVLYLRSVYRIVEFADGYGGKIYSAEWAFYVFDTILILITFLTYMVCFIGHNFQRASTVSSGVHVEEPVPKSAQ